MDHYGTESKGRLIIEEVEVVPPWSIYNKGRFLFASDENCYYLGGTKNWIRFAGESKITPEQLDLGSKLKQINAMSIPLRNTSGYFEDGMKVETALEKIVTGQLIQPDAILGKHIFKNTITTDNLKFGTTGTQIGAQSIPYYHPIDKTTTLISDTLDTILNTYPVVINKEIKLTMWDYDATQGLFECSFFYTNLRNEYPVVQCYDEYGSVFIPSKLVLEKHAKRFRLWSPYKMVIYIAIMG